MYKRKRFGSENYLINPGESKDMICYEIDELKFWNKLIKALSLNLEFAKKNLCNYNHISIWNTLLELSKQSIFRQLYDKYSGKEDKINKKNKKKNNVKNKSLDDEEILYNFHEHIKLSPFATKLMTNLYIKQLSQIIEYLIDTYGDIYLATIICYLFKPVLFQDEKLKLRILRMIRQCICNLRKYQLYIPANHLIKYGPEEINKIGESKDFIFIFSCKNCGRNKFDEGKCKCGKILSCEECHKKASGLFIWCPGCGHGGHINHINKVNTLYSCKACNHHCIYS